MRRTLPPLLAVALLGFVPPLRAQESPAVGTWRLSFPVETRQGEVNITFLLMFSDSDGKLVADVLGTNPELGAEPSVTDVVAKDNQLGFAIKLGPQAFTFDGRVAADGKKVSGSFSLGGPLILVEMRPSKLKTLKDTFALRRETLEQAENGGEFFSALFPAVAQAGAKKVKPEEVRSWADKAGKLAEPYGTRWQRHVALRLATALADQEAYLPVALEQARQAERLLTTGDEIATHMQTLETLARVMEKAGKADEVKQIQGRLAKLEVRDYQEYAKKNPPFKPEPFEGRKAKSDRAVLVELFTGSECPPCVAADLACDALDRTYKPTDVVVLQYHLHVPGPDPMTNKDSVARADFYGNKVEGTPTVFINGKKEDNAGGPVNLARLKYKTFRENIEGELDKPAPLKLQVSAARKGDEIAIKASVSDVQKPGDKVRLRFALAEERVRYQGGNGLRYHHNVVRAMPGNAAGFALTMKSSEHTAAVKLPELRAGINKYLDEFAKEEDVTFEARPLALKGLSVVAFVQDDATGEVLQVVRVDAEEKKAE